MTDTLQHTSQETAISTDPWITFLGTVAARRQIGHSIVRITCAGEDFSRFADTGYDQRVKLILPLADSGYASFPTGPDWYQRWRTLPADQQNPIRTYTVRAVRQAYGEVDIDLVLHGITGPASAWASQARVGDPVALLGPNARYGGDHGGIEFRAPGPNTRLLLAGDETAQPAITRTLEQLPADARGTVLLEMPHADDVIDLIKPAGIDVQWLIRGDRPVGEPMLSVFADHARNVFGDHEDAAPAVDLDALEATEPSDDEQLIWDVSLPPATADGYAWIAGEAAMVRTMRRILVNDLGVDRGSVAFMGYWRL